MNIPPFMATWRDPGTVTPFTTRTNASYLKILYDMRDYMTGTLVAAIDAEFASQFTNITEQVDALIVQLNEHGEILDADIAQVAANLASAIAAANAAAASAVGANNSAVAAAGSATAASTSATAAGGSATAAAGSATAAAGSAATAATAGAAAGTTAGATAGAAAASPYATAAAASATAAATSATNAGNSATAAATSATNAGSAATAAITAQKNAANGLAPLDASSLVPAANLPAHLQVAALTARFATRTVADFDAVGSATTFADSVTLVTEGNVLMVPKAGTWVQLGVATFASATARDTAYNKASGAYKVNNALIYRTDKLRGERYYTVAVKTTAGWYWDSGNPEVGTLTPNTGVTLNTAGDYLELFRLNGVVYCTFEARAGSNLFTPASYLLATIPTGFRPTGEIFAGAGAYVGSGPVAAVAQVQASGSVIGYCATAAPRMGVNASWRLDTPVLD